MTSPTTICDICKLHLTFRSPPASPTVMQPGSAGSWLDDTGSPTGTDGHFHTPIVRHTWP
jgi:hypothetical protein